MELSDVILRAYPWWEMQRVRELSIRSKTPGKHLFNQWRHTAELVDHHYRGVTTPNCDTLYSGAWLDLDAGPILIDVPESDLPYWSIAVMDLNTDNIAILGSHRPDGKSLLICHQDYNGTVPDGTSCVRSATKVLWLLARYLIGSDDLVAQAEAMRHAVRLERWQSDTNTLVNAASAPRTNLPIAVRNDSENFWSIVCTTLDEDQALLGSNDSAMYPAFQAAWPLGIKEWSGLDADLQLRFTEAFNRVLHRTTANNSGNMTTRNGWRYPGKDIGNFGDNAQYRAEVSLWGLGALPTDEVIYVSAITDTQGDTLQGKHQYRFRIPVEGIPAKAFWSLTMYEVDPHGGMYFTANPLKRYAIGDRTEGLKANADGCIDIWITHAQPADLDKQANWLPAPLGLFRVMIRAYAASPAFQSGEVPPPSVEKWV